MLVHPGALHLRKIQTILWNEDDWAYSRLFKPLLTFTVKNLNFKWVLLIHYIIHLKQWAIVYTIKSRFKRMTFTFNKVIISIHYYIITGSAKLELQLFAWIRRRLLYILPNINLCGGFWMLSNLLDTQIRLKSPHQLQFWVYVSGGNMPKHADWLLKPLSVHVQYWTKTRF